MKMRKRILLIVLALALMFSLSACGSFETRMVGAARKMVKLESLRMDTDVDMTMKISLFGETITLDGGMSGQTDVRRQPLRMRGSLAAELLDEEPKGLMAMEKTEDGYILYLSLDEGDTWVSRRIEAKSLSNTVSAKNLLALAKLASAFEESGTEEIRGSAATVYSGVIPGEDIRLALTNSGVLTALGDALKVDFTQMEQSELSDVPATVALDDESGMLVRCTVDLTGIMEDLMGSAMEQLLALAAEKAGLDWLNVSALDMELGFSQVKISVDLYDFDQVESVEMPNSSISA